MSLGISPRTGAQQHHGLVLKNFWIYAGSPIEDILVGYSVLAIVLRKGNDHRIAITDLIQKGFRQFWLVDFGFPVFAE
ncbi:MAG: hypothetical protein ACI87W_000985 [Halieaceae bacterium]|jgi:hypothetical protein